MIITSRDWTIKIMVRNAADNTIRGSYRPMRILQFYFNAQQKGNSPTQFNEEVAFIDFQDETTKYSANITTIWDGDQTGLHLSLRTETQAKQSQGNRPLNLNKAGPKSTKVQSLFLYSFQYQYGILRLSKPFTEKIYIILSFIGCNSQSDQKFSPQ